MSDAMRPEVTTLVEASRDLQLRSLDAGLLSVDGTLALEVRDVLAEVDKEGLSLALAEAVTSSALATEKRIRAAWLLKDLACAASWRSLVQTASDVSEPRELRLTILDTLERIAFGGQVVAGDLSEPSRVFEQDAELFRRWVMVLATLSTPEAIAVLREHCRNPERRNTVLAVIADYPNEWVDAFLEEVLALDGGDPVARAVVAERRYGKLVNELSERCSPNAVGEQIVKILSDRTVRTNR